VITVGVMFTKGKIDPAAGYTGSIGKAGAFQLAVSRLLMLVQGLSSK
jgi:hypothetical protein